MLNILENRGSQSVDETKRVRQDYERKINDMRSQIGQMKAAEREHSRLLKQSTQSQQELQKLRRDLDDMKKAKVISNNFCMGKVIEYLWTNGVYFPNDGM